MRCAAHDKNIPIFLQSYFFLRDFAQQKEGNLSTNQYKII